MDSTYRKVERDAKAAARAWGWAVEDGRWLLSPDRGEGAWEVQDRIRMMLDRVPLPTAHSAGCEAGCYDEHARREAYQRGG